MFPENCYFESVLFHHHAVWIRWQEPANHLGLKPGHAISELLAAINVRKVE